MEVLTNALILFIVLFHVQAFILESLLWQTPRALKAFGTDAKSAKIMQPLAFNQGVYNLFLAAGLLLSFLLYSTFRTQAQVFFLGCIIVAALAAGFSVSRKIMLLQGLPALLALCIVIAQ